jgi:hypothetical protein
VKVILKHMEIRIKSNSIYSTLSNTLSMGEDLKDEREKGYMEFKDRHHHKMLIIFSC